jgi:hypothetical protein
MARPSMLKVQKTNPLQSIAGDGPKAQQRTSNGNIAEHQNRKNKPTVKSHLFDMNPQKQSHLMPENVRLSVIDIASIILLTPDPRP